MNSKVVKVFVEVAKRGEIAPGGMKAVEVKGTEIVLCNYEGQIYALERRCGHMNAPLDKGTLEGYIVTCPLHYAQFDITTGEVLSRPVPRMGGGRGPPPSNAMRHTRMLMSHIKMYDRKTYPVKVEGDSIQVAV